MSDTRDLASVLAAADQAAAAGDPVSAEKLLREAAAIQEVSLGPLHPDLANTLNNLAVVCEMTDRPGDAERYYRKAAAIAATSLGADHPLVATSRKNLEDFCAARGIPVEPPVLRLAPVATPPTPPARPAPPRPAPAVPHPAPARRSNPLAIGGVIVVGVAVVMLVASRTWTSDAPTASGADAAASSPPVPATSTARPQTPAEGSHATITPVDRTPVTRSSAATGTAPPGVANARLCRALTTGTVDWSCEATMIPIGRGPIYFYTRLTSARDTTVRHRWYRDGQLQRTVDLAIDANLGRGYRTYSRMVLDSFSVGEWRVELRSKDGALLHEERFIVR